MPFEYFFGPNLHLSKQDFIDFFNNYRNHTGRIMESLTTRLTEYLVEQLGNAD